MIANMLGSDGLIVLVVAVVVLFGGSQLPKLAKNVGSAGREFRRAQNEAEMGHAQQEAADQHAAAAVPAPVLPAPVLPAPVLPAPVTADDLVVLSRSELKQHVASLMQARDGHPAA
jgi:sec-independent protein translocase protein TatA